MLRPLPPFRVRPLKKAAVRKALPAGILADLSDDDLLVSIKGFRRPLKHLRPAVAARLKVLSRNANDHA
jgi:hypothetical protein